MITLVCLVVAYLLGSISSAVILAKLMNKPDPRLSGSGNPGATNALRTGGKTMGALVLLIDMLKGLVAVLIGRFFGIDGFSLALVGLFAVLGHIFPVFFKFEGGKGVATALGVALALNFWLGLLCLGLWIAVAKFTRYASLASMIAVLAACILTLVVSQSAYFVPLLIIASLVIWRHQENIARLRIGTENKIKL